VNETHQAGLEADKWMRWMIALAVMVAAVMELVDTSAVNVSLPYIAGNLSSSVDEATWVLTSYLVANAIVLPISGWLAQLFWPQAASVDECCRIQYCEHPVWGCMVAAVADFLSRAAGSSGRFTATDDARDYAGGLSA
jgi:MFS family permease